jgi:hypothetical protein
MPSSIDNKIVEMQFDNANFEKNVKQSIKTLEQLNKALELEDAAKGFEQMEKAAESIDFSKLMSACDTIEKRFSTMGIAGAALVNRVVNGLVDGVVNLGKSVVNLAKTGGIARAMKLEHANFMLKGLLKDEQLVADMISGPISNSVKGTAYGLDAAANAAAQFAASGITGMEELETALTAVSGVAAMTGSEFEDISSIFTTIAGQGKVMTRQLRQIEARGLNAAAAIAQSLKVTEEEVRDMVQHGEISFEMFSEAMYDAFAEQAKKANDTFDGALRNLKAALSRIGAKIATPALEGLRQVFVSLIDAVDAVNDILSEGIFVKIIDFIKHVTNLAQLFFKSQRFIGLLEGAIWGLESAIDWLTSILKPFQRAFRDVFNGDIVEHIYNMEDAFISFMEQITLSQEEMHDLEYTFRGILDIIDLFVSAIGALLDLLIPGLGSVYDVSDSLATKILKLSGFVGFLIDKWHDLIKDFGWGEGTLRFIGLLFNDMYGFMRMAIGVFNQVKEGVQIAGMIIVASVYSIGAAIYNLIDYVSNLQIVQDAFATIASTLSFIANNAIPVLYALGGSILYVVDGAYKLSKNGIGPALASITDALNPFKKEVKGATKVVQDMTETFVDEAGNIVEAEKKMVKFNDNFAESTKKMSGASKVVVNTSTDSQQAIKDVSNTAQKEGNLFIDFINEVKRVLSNIDVSGNLFAIGFGAVIIVTLVNIAKAIGRVSRLFRSIGRVADSVRYFMISLTAGINAFALTEVAVAIGLLAAALYVLVKTCDVKTLALTAAILGGLILTMVASLKALEGVKFTTLMKLSDVGKYLISFSGSVLILAVALEKINSVSGSWQKMLGNITMLMAILSALVGVAMILGLKELNTFKGGLNLIAVSASVYVIACSLEKLGTLDLDAARRAMPILMEILSGLALVMFLSSLMLSPLAGIGMMGVVASVLLLIKGCEYLTQIDTAVLDQALNVIDRIGEWAIKVLQWAFWLAVVVKGFETLQTYLNYLSLQTDAVSSIITKMFGGINAAAKRLSNAMSIASIFVGITSSVLIIVIAMEKIAKMAKDPATFKQAGETVAAIAAGMLLVAASIFALSKYLSKNPIEAISIQNTMNSISLVLLSMTACVAIMSILPSKGIGQAWASLAIITAFLIALVAAISFINKEVGPMMAISMVTIGALAALFGAMTITFAIFALMPFAAWLQGMGGLLLVTVGIGGVLAVLANLAPLTAPAAVAVGLISVLFITLTGCFYVLQSINGAAVLDTLGYMLLAVTGMAAVVGILGIVIPLMLPVAKIGAIAMAALIGMMAGLATVGILVSQIDGEAIKNLFIKIGEGIAGFVTTLLTLGAVITVTPPSVLIAVAAAMLFLANVLPPLAAGFLIFSVAALTFSAAAFLFGTAIGIIATGLSTLFNSIALIQNADLNALGQGLAIIGACCVALGICAAPLIAFAIALQVLGTAMITVSAAIFLFTGAMAVLATEGMFTNLGTNILQLCAAIDTLAEHFVSFVAVALEAAAIGAGFLVLGTGILAVSAALLVLAATLLIVNIAVSTFVNIMRNLSTSIQEAVAAMSTLSVDIINTVYNGLMDNAYQLEAAGAQLCVEVATGFENQIEASFRTCIQDTVVALENEARAQEAAVKAAGEILGKAYDQGVREPTGSFCENAHTDLPDDTTEAVVNQANRDADAVYGGGATLGDAYGKGVWDRVKEWLSGIMDNIRNWWENLWSGNFMAGMSMDIGSLPGTDLINEYKNSLGDLSSYNDPFKNGRYQYRGPGAGYTDTWTGETKNLISGGKSSARALKMETDALNANTGAVGGNSKAKKANEKANDDKTAAIDEETESLEGEEEQTNETSEAIREMAEQIEVTTEKYNWLNHYMGLMTKTTGRLRRYQINSGKIWSGEYETVSQITKAMKDLAKAIPTTVKASSRGLYKFADESKKVSKVAIKGTLKYTTSLKNLKAMVEKTGQNFAKVAGDTVRVYYKAGNKVSSIAMNATKGLNKIPKMFKKAMSTIKYFQGDLNRIFESYEWSDEVIADLRKIEDSFGKVKFGKLDEGIQKYLRRIRDQFKELDPAIRQISRSLGGTYQVFSKNNRAAVATMDALVSLGAVLYNGSEAANEYATQIARLEFLAEHGEISWEEVEEARVAYLTRIKDALLEYKQALEQTYGAEIDMYKMFEKNQLEEGTNILKTQASNIAAYYTYGEMLTELSRRIPNLETGTQLVKQFADAGIDSFGKLEAVLKLNNDELQAFVYGIGVLNKTQEELSNKAFAAVANATSYASKREQARTKDIATKTTKYSAKVRKAIESDMYAMAQATTEYNNLFKKEEKAYLKTLTKSEKKQYKKYKNDLKYAKKKYKQQQKQLTLEEKINKIMESITDYKTYSEFLGKYATDLEALTEVSKKLSKAFEEVNKELAESGVMIDQSDVGLLRFADTLDSSGESGLNYFEELAARVKRFTEQVIDSVKSVNILTTAFEKADKITSKDISKNAISQLAANQEANSLIRILTGKGFSSNVISVLTDMTSSDMAGALALMQSLVNYSAAEIAELNAYYDLQDEQAKLKAALLVGMNSNALKSKAEYEKAEEIAKVEYEAAAQAREASLSAVEAAEQNYNNVVGISDALNKLRKKDDKGKLTKGDKESVKTFAKNLKQLYKDFLGQDLDIKGLSTAQLYLRAETLKGALYRKLGKAQKDYIDKEMAAIAAADKYQNATKELNDYLNRTASTVENLKKRIDLQIWFDNNITSAEKLISVMKSLNKSTDEYAKCLMFVSEVEQTFGKILVKYNNDPNNFKNIKELFDKTFRASHPIQNITDGIIAFGQSLLDADENAKKFGDDLTAALEEYQKTLKSTMNSSSDFFSMFKGFADEDSPLKSSDYLKYGASQIKALQEWQANLIKLTDMGLNKELVERFASEGLGSFEEVSAWAQATEDEIKEYNGMWAKYKEEIENATTSAMTSIAAAYSVAGDSLASAMIKNFSDESFERLKDTGSNAAGMIVIGIKDGLTNAMPEIVDKLVENDTENTMATKIGATVGAALNEGIVQAVSNSVEATVTAAIEKFKMAVNSINAYIDETLNDEWTITIHVNTSEIDDAVARMNSAIYGINASAGATSAAVTSSISNNNPESVEPTVTNASPSVINLNYTQNNTSPKALSRPEIYRQTRNQLSTIESVIAATGG